MVLATLVQILVGLLAPVLLARVIHRRWGTNRALVIPGALAGLGLLVLNALVQAIVARGVLAAPVSSALPIFAGLLGAAQGLLAALALVAVFVWLAPGARRLARVLMVGVGFGGAELTMRAVLAALVLAANLQLALFPPEGVPPSDPAILDQQAQVEAYFATPPSGPLWEAVGAAGRLAHGVTVAVLVGTLFLTGEVGWFFGGWFWAALGAIGAVLFGQAGPASGALWWAMLGGISVVIVLRRLRRTPASLLSDGYEA
ncbi:MAG: hypothetical protein Kow0077_19180 [Anaerolineae bacterium]